jgi:putative tryptophan/tyrosine transport system substrate-binding protein
VKRREFITLVGGAAAWPLATQAQQPALPVVGFLSAATEALFAAPVAAFLQSLKESGFVEGGTVAIEYRSVDGHADRLPSLAAELVRNEVAVIVATGGVASALAAKAATSTIPIVVTFGSDPVKLGLVASLSRPGGNISGVTFLATQFVGKRLDLLRALVPQATTIAFLSQTQDPTAAAQESDVVCGGEGHGQGDHRSRNTQRPRL